MDSQRVVLHEISHVLDNEKHVRETSLCSYVSRVEGGKSSRLYYGSREEAFDDKFSSKYVGKLYGDGSTEFMSMGIENFHDLDALAKFVHADPHHFASVYATLKGYMK